MYSKLQNKYQIYWITYVKKFPLYMYSLQKATPMPVDSSKPVSKAPKTGDLNEANKNAKCSLKNTRI